MSAFDDVPFPDYEDHGQTTTTLGDIKRWLANLEEFRRLNNLPAISDDLEVHIGRSFHGHADIFVHLMPGVRHGFTFFDRARDKAFHTQAKIARVLKKRHSDERQLAYRDAWKDYAEFGRTELDEIFGGRPT